MKKDSSIELFRLIGCFIVIGVHIPFSPVINNSFDFSRTFMQCILGDGVAVFWVITGCFLFKSLYEKVLKRTVKTIVVPLVLFNVFFFFLNDFLYNNIAITESVAHSLGDYAYLIKNFLFWRNSTEFVHLWYMYVYSFLMLLYPLIKSFVLYLDESDKRKKIYIFVSFLLLVLNDVSNNQLFGFSHSLIGAFFPAVNLFIYGHILYRNRCLFISKKWIFIGPVLFVAVNIVRALLQYNAYLQGDQVCHLLFWFTTFGLVSTVLLFAFCTSIMSNFKNVKLSEITGFFASYTFPIYIIHLPIIKLLEKYGVLSLLSNKIYSLGSNFVIDFWYMGTIIIFVFVTSLLISAIYRLVLSIVKLIVNRLNIKT